jgi:predicted transcriptional regulator
MGAKADARRLESMERRVTALKLRKRGFSYRDIATHLKVTPEAVRQMVKKETDLLQGELSELAEDVRTLDVARLDQMMARAMNLAVPTNATDDPDLRAMETVLKIMDRKAKLLGLDAPKQLEIMTVDKIDEEIARLEEQQKLQGGNAPVPAEPSKHELVSPNGANGASGDV